MELGRAAARLAVVPVVAALFLVVVVAAVLGDDPPPAVAACLPSGAGPVAGVPYEAEIVDAAAQAGIDPRLVAAVARMESGFDPSAVSAAGAVGIMQVMPATFAGYSAGDPADPAESLRVGAAVLASYFRAFGTWELALAAYNAGPGAVQAAGGIPPYPETQAYVGAVLAAWAELAAASGDGAEPPPAPCAPPTAVGAYGFVVEPSAVADPAWLTGPHHDYAAVDVPVPVGTLVYAAVEGVVVAATPDDGGRCGGTVLVDGTDGARYVYCHLAGVLAAGGQAVGPGSPVGLSGGVPGMPGAGSSRGAHLHFGIEVAGVKACPQLFLAALYAGQAPPAPATLPIGGCVE